MKRFQKGDRVRCVNNAHASSLLTLGEEGVVVGYVHEGLDTYLNVMSGGAETHGWHESRWVLLTDMPDTRDYLNALSGYPSD